jgi:hypothetical protein
MGVSSVGCLGGPGECDCRAVVPPAQSPARASALARTTSGSRGSGGKASCQGRSRRTVGWWIRIRCTVVSSPRSATQPVGPAACIGPWRPRASRTRWPGRIPERGRHCDLRAASRRRSSSTTATSYGPPTAPSSRARACSRLHSAPRARRPRPAAPAATGAWRAPRMRESRHTCVSAIVLPFLRHPARSPALLAGLFGERYGFGPPWRVTRRWLPGGVSPGGDRSPEGAIGQAWAVSGDQARLDQAWRNVRQLSRPPNPVSPGPLRHWRCAARAGQRGAARSRLLRTRWRTTRMSRSRWQPAARPAAGV